MVQLDLQPLTTSGGRVNTTTDDSWRLSLPAGPQGKYRLAQLDDYRAHRRRSELPWRAPLAVQLQARSSSDQIPGTWGVGLWNDPFGISLGLAGASRRLPALPNATWFFFASPPNHLSLRDDRPAQGALAATFRSPGIPAAILGMGLPALLLLTWPPTARVLRQAARRVIRQDTATLPFSHTEWHTYSLNWGMERVVYKINGQMVFETSIVPLGPLGLVLWVDNQYASFPPSGKFDYGFLECHEEVWVEIRNIEVSGVEQKR